MRLFIAIPLPKTVKQKLLDLQQPIDGILWQRAEQMHLTLKFVGEVDHQKAKELREQLTDIQHPGSAISIEGIGYFPEGKQPKVVWAGVEKNEWLVELHQKVERCCEQIGVAPESRPFKPHITLGRVKGASKRTVNSFINQHKKFAVTEMPVNEYVLYESKLEPDGAKHSRLQAFALSANG